MRITLATTPAAVLADGSVLPLAPRDAALLAWLALEGPTARNRLAALLWPDSAPEAARNALRQRLFQLRRSVGAELVAGSTVLQLAAGVAHDLEDADGVLGDLVAPADGEFAYWLERQRARRQRRVRDVLAELAQMAEDVHDYADALVHAQELLALEPLAEDAHRRVMRLSYLGGDRAAALLAFDRCERTLKDEVGTRPSPATLAMLQLIERSVPAAGANTPALPAALLRPPRLVARAAELDALRAAWQARQPFLLLGEAGIGKSRLLETFAEGWPGACIVRARPGDGESPLALVARLVDAVCAAHPARRAWPCAQRLAAALQPTLVPHDGGQRPSPQPLSAPLSELLTLAAAKGAPLALLFDDWQFADTASVELLESALPAALRVGHASRSAAGARADARIAALRQHAERQVVVLAPLAADAVGALLASLDLADAQGALAQALRQRVGGSPLYLLEALRQMHERRLPLAAAHVGTPRRVRDLVAERLAALADETRRLLRIAVIAGDDFGVELAEGVSGRDALVLADDWHRLETLGLLGGDAVSHDVYAEVVQTELPAPIARTLHARVAAWLEPRPHDSARLAAHWRAAGEDTRAVPHLLAAARGAWGVARAADAFELYRQAAEIEAAAGRGDAAFDHWFDNADAMSEIGTLPLLALCVAGVAQHAHNERQRLRLGLLLAVQRWMGGEVDSGVTELAALLTQAIALGDVRVEVECRFALAHRAAADGRFDEAVQQLAAGERLLRDQGDARRAAALAASIALLIGIRGQPRLAQAEQRRLLPLLVQERDVATACVVAASEALQQVRQGHLSAGVEQAQGVLARLSQVSIAPGDLALTLGYTVDALRWAGRFDAALDAALALRERLQVQGAANFGLAALAALYLHLGRADLAHGLLAQLVAEASLRARDRSRLALLRTQAALLNGLVAPDDTPADALAGDDLALAAEWALWSGLRDTAPQPADPLHALAAQALQGGFVLMAEPLAALADWRSAQAGAPATAPPAASTAHAATPWTALFEARSAALRHDPARAHGCAQRGADWLRRCAAQAVPLAMRDSFLQRHPAHRELLLLAQTA